MDFSDALRLLRDGKKMRRRVWENSYAELAQLQIPDTSTSGQLIIIRHPDGILRLFGCAQWDILSDDWEPASQSGDGNPG